jgi:beta-mannanase
VYLPGIFYDEFDSLELFEQQIDHRMRYTLWYQAWGEPAPDFPSELVQLADDRGTIPIITWEPWKRDFDNPGRIQLAYTLATIVNGKHDRYIRAWARAARSTGVPLILRFAHEQSTEPGRRRWYPWQGDPEGYKTAFRHVVTLFREEGATNVQFLWSAMWLDEWAPQYYPGDDFVDLVGTTVLNHGTVPSEQWALWRTFDELFSEQHRSARRWDKPIIITEWASAEQGGDKAAWLGDGLASLKFKYPLVQGVVLFEVPSDREWPIIDWTVSSSPNALAAFKEAIRDPYFK